MKNVYFYDGVCPKPYNMIDLVYEPMGGTEATVLRISTELYKTNRVEVRQKGFNLDKPMPDAGVIVTLRDAGHYRTNQAAYPLAKHYLWLHDHISGDYYFHLRQHLEQMQSGHIICVSEYHKHNFVDNFRQLLQDKQGKIKVSVIYNPLADYCSKDPTTLIDKNKLVYFSSPHKGLEGVLKLFEMIHRLDPAMTLYLANPGYIADHKTLSEGVINLGSLPHKQVVEHVRTALCVFYPNMVFPETFGLVYAEANAVGTPVIAHPIGAAREILSHPKEVLDCRDYKAVVNRVLEWKNGNRPTVAGKPEFLMQNVIKKWEKLL